MQQSGVCETNVRQMDEEDNLDMIVDMIDSCDSGQSGSSTIIMGTLTLPSVLWINQSFINSFLLSLLLFQDKSILIAQIFCKLVLTQGFAKIGFKLKHNLM